VVGVAGLHGPLQHTSFYPGEIHGHAAICTIYTNATYTFYEHFQLKLYHIPKTIARYFNIIIQYHNYIKIHFEKNLIKLFFGIEKNKNGPRKYACVRGIGGLLKEGYCEELEKGKNYAVNIITNCFLFVNYFLSIIFYQ